MYLKLNLLGLFFSFSFFHLRFQGVKAGGCSACWAEHGVLFMQRNFPLHDSADLCFPEVKRMAREKDRQRGDDWCERIQKKNEMQMTTEKWKLTTIHRVTHKHTHTLFKLNRSMTKCFFHLQQICILHPEETGYLCGFVCVWSWTQSLIALCPYPSFLPENKQYCLPICPHSLLYFLDWLFHICTLVLTVELISH